MPSLATFGQVVDASSSPMAVLSLDGRFLSANPAYGQLVGRDAEDLLGASSAALTHPADVRPCLEAIQTIRQAGGSRRILKRYVRPDGGVVWADVLLSALVDDGGHAVGVLCHGHLADGPSAERETLTESEARFRAALDNAPIGMAVVGLDGEWLQVNRVLCAILRRTPEDLSRQRLRFDDVMDAADLQRDVAIRRDLAEGRSDWARGTRRLHREDGSWVWCDITVSLIRGSGGEPIHHLLHVVELGDGESPSEFGGGHHLTEVASASEELLYYRLLLQPEVRFEHVSESVQALCGYTPGDFYGDPKLMFDIIHPDDAPQLLSLLAEPDRAARELVFRWRHRDGREVVTRSRHTSVHRSGEAVALEGILVDITRQREAERDRSMTEARLRSLVQNSTDVLVVTTADGVVTYATPSLERSLGWSADESIGASIWDHVHPDDAAELRRAYTGTSPAVTMRMAARSGQWRWHHAVVTDLSQDRAVGGVVINARDIHDQRAAEEALREHAVTDLLTGLPNRALIQDRVAQAVLRNADRPSAVAVVTVNLDRFKRINDALGYGGADTVLVEVAARLVAATPTAHTVGRVAVDEFVVCGEEFTDAEEIRAYAERLRAAVVGPVEVDGVSVTVGASAGVAIADAADVGADELLRRSASALVAAKEQGGGAVAFHDPSTSGQARARARFEQRLFEAASRGELVAHYQPIVDLDTGAPVAAEALVRWMHPTDGLIGPDEFICIAEESGAILDIGAWVLDDACRNVRAWRGIDGMADFTVSVNLAARQLAERSTVDLLADVLERHQLPTTALTVEVTESAALGHGHLAVLNDIHSLGVPIALDDFGTHYSSLSYLQRLPVRHLKIDRSFVTGIGVDRHRRAIVGATAQLGRALRLTTVAEGIEDPRESAELQLLGIDRGQGYLFGRPMPAEDLTALLERQAGTRSS